MQDGQLTTIGGNQGGITVTTYALNDPSPGIRGFSHRMQGRLVAKTQR